MEKLTKKQQIKDIKEGDLINDIFVVKIKKSIRPYVKGHTFSLILSDSGGGSIEYKYWGGQDEEKVRNVYTPILQDSVILVTGKVDTYNNKLGINADEFSTIRILKPEEYEADFIMTSKKNIDAMYTSLLFKVDSIINPDLKKLVQDIFIDIEEKFKNHPGGIQIHHNWIGGLLEHTLEVVDYCETSLKLFPKLDKDLLITGALIHDVGKLEEMEMTSRIKGTQKGQLMGHLVLGLNYISKKLDKSELDDLTKNKLLHLLTSHHGKLEFGSPKEAMFPEALALYHADELSSKISEMIDFIEESKESTEDEFMYHYRKGTNIFLK